MANTDLKKRRAVAVPKGIGKVIQRFSNKALNAELWDEQRQELSRTHVLYHTNFIPTPTGD